MLVGMSHVSRNAAHKIYRIPTLRQVLVGRAQLEASPTNPFVIAEEGDDEA